MRVKVLMGTNKIGGCITEISTFKTKIIIDFGEDLPVDNKNVVRENPNIDGLTTGNPKYDAVFITHSHGDHIGLIDFILPSIPVFVEPVSKRIYERLSAFTGKCARSETVDMSFEDKISVGDMVITPYFVDHSSFNSCMLLVEADGKRVLHTGDFRNHGLRGKEFIRTLNKIGKVDMIVTEGTSLGRNDGKYKSEEEISIEAEKLFEKYDQVFVMQSSTNIDRICSFYKASKSTNKNFIEDVFTSNITCALDSLSVPNPKYNDDVYTWIPIKYKKKDVEFKSKYVDVYKEFSKQCAYRNKNYTMIVKSSMLDDIKKLFDKGFISNACLVYSMWSGYKDNQDVKYFLSEIKKYGVKDIVDIHTSGHADRETINLLNSLDAFQVVPIHTSKPMELENILNNVVVLRDEEVLDVMSFKDSCVKIIQNSKYEAVVRSRHNDDSLVYLDGQKALEITDNFIKIKKDIFNVPAGKIREEFDVNSEFLSFSQFINDKKELLDLDVLDVNYSNKISFRFMKKFRKDKILKDKLISFLHANSKFFVERELERFMCIVDHVEDIYTKLDEELVKDGFIVKENEYVFSMKLNVDRFNCLQDFLEFQFYIQLYTSKHPPFKKCYLGINSILLKLSNNKDDNFKVINKVLDALHKTLVNYNFHVGGQDEKVFQDLLMKKRVVSKLNCMLNLDLEPIEEELDLPTLHRDGKGNNGRIDNVYVNKLDGSLVFMEVKYNDKVISSFDENGECGLIGVYSHLFDLYYTLMNKRIEFEKRLDGVSENISIRNVNSCDEERIDDVNLDKFSYLVVCGYDSLIQRDSIRNKIFLSKEVSEIKDIMVKLEKIGVVTNIILVNVLNLLDENLENREVDFDSYENITEEIMSSNC